MTASSPRVSIILPTHNRAWCLRSALTSVMEQTFQDFELILVDDASTDSTAQVLAEFPRLILLRNEKKSGVSCARNLGLEQARAPYICFLDSDDRWTPDKLAVQWRWMQSHPQDMASYTDEIWIRNGVRVNPKKKHQKYSGDIFKHCLPLCLISPSSVMMTSEVLGKIGRFDESLPACEDYDLWLRLTARYPVHFISQKLIVKTGGHADQLSKKYWGMDCFRVYALNKLLSQNNLTGERRRWALEMLIQKCCILQVGFTHRGKMGPARLYQQAVQAFTRDLEGAPCLWENKIKFGREVLSHALEH